MKTTVDIPDSLLAEAKEVAARRRTTLRALVEEGLRHALDPERQKPDFRLRDARVDGNGVQPEFRNGGWERIREATYAGRGG